MNRSRGETTQCFLCHRKNAHFCMSTTICPASKKFIVDVIEFLAKNANCIMHIPNGEQICFLCHAQIVDYDTSLVKLLKKQEHLSKLVERAIVNTDSDNDYMDIIEETKYEDLFTDENISDTEISQTIEEVSTGGAHINSNKNVCTIKQDSDLIQCNFCASRFKSKFRLQKHISQTHKKFSCELCDYSHRNQDYVKLHMNSHEGKRENQCRFCDKDFTTKISTIRHMECHMDSKKYQCDKCGLCFSQTTVLYNHKLQHEAEERPLQCELCQQVFKTKRTFRHHMITHRADRPRYSCEFCTKTFTEKYTLKVHKRSHHEPINTLQQPNCMINEINDAVSSISTNKYTCIICDQSFTSKDQMNKHMEKEHDVILKSLNNMNHYEVIIGEAKKSCHICGQSFSIDFNLDQHMEEKHGYCIK